MAPGHASRMLKELNAELAAGVDQESSEHIHEVSDQAPCTLCMFLPPPSG